jgi:NADH dehydrogenase
MSTRSMRVVVLGGTGFVGSHMVPRIAAAGHQVLVLSRNREQHREMGVMPGVTVRSADVYSADVLASHFAEADAVVQLVGILNESGFDGAGFRRAHVELPRTVIASMKRAGVRRLLHMSSLKAGEGESHYLQTRGEGEALVKASGLEWSILQPSVIFGPGDGLFNRFAGLLKLAPLMPLGRADAKLAPVYVGDVCEAFLRALGDRGTVGKSYELYGPRVMSLREIVAYTRDQLGLKRPVIGLPDALGWLQAAALGLVPGKPLSLDNFRSLAVDSVGSSDGLAALGIEATAVETIVPRMLRGELGKQDELDRYRERRTPPK